MGARGPKSETETLSPVPSVLPERPRPPAHLNDEGKARWVEIVGEWPVDRFRGSDRELLAELILSEQYVRQCDENIAAHGQVVGPGVQENPAVRLRERHMRIMVALQRALRLCPSMRTRQDDSALKPKPRKRSWEM